MTKLTQQQREFAEKNHDEVYKFLGIRHLPVEEYYDVVIMGYLEAVQDYDTKLDLQKTYSFVTIAKVKMKAKLYSYWTYKNRLKRKADIYSLDVSLNDTDSIQLHTVLCDPLQDTENEVEKKLICEDVLKCMDRKEKRIAYLLNFGFSYQEIAERENMKIKELTNCLKRTRRKMHSLVSDYGRHQYEKHRDFIQ